MDNNDFFDNIEKSEKVKCVNCGKEFPRANLKKGCPYCGSKEDDDTRDYSTILKEKNNVASAFKVIAWITLIIGLIAGFILLLDTDEIIVLLVTWLISGGAFLSIYAIGEIIQILHDIRFKIYEK